MDLVWISTEPYFLFPGEKKKFPTQNSLSKTQHFHARQKLHIVLEVNCKTRILIMGLDLWFSTAGSTDSTILVYKKINAAEYSRSHCQSTDLH